MKLRKRWFGVLAFLTCPPLSAAAPTVPEARLYELLPPLWQPAARNYLRDWLLCGPFPNPPHPGQRTYDHTPPCVGFETDYLTEHGGQERIHPAPGMTHTLPDGTVRRWIRYVSPTDVVDLREAFPGRTHDNEVAYAFRTVVAQQAGPRYLAVGSDDGVQVWVNGKLVHEHLVARGVKLDEDLVPVLLRTGENTLLLKVENGGGAWGLSCRLLEPSVLLGENTPFAPKLESRVGDDPLVVWTNAAPAVPQAGEVLVQVVRPGGIILATVRAPTGRRVEFPTGDWPEGTLEIRCTLDIGFGRRLVRYLPWYCGNPQAVASRLVAAAGKANPRTPLGAHLKLLRWIAADRAGDLHHLDARNVLKAHSALEEFEEVELEEAGETGPVHGSGFVRLVYFDEVDGSPQYGRAYLPPGYTPSRRWPLVLNLHGYNPENPPYVKWEQIDARHHRWADTYGVIVVEPLGRYNSWYKGIGAQDVLRCLALAKARFAVDEDRVYLTGWSMGGGGVWEIGTRRPELFAALAPVFGGWDDRLFLTKTQREALTPRQRFVAAAYSSFARAESLMNVPVFVNHGTDDEYVSVSHARFVVRTLQRWGYKVRYWEHPHGTHDPDKLGHEPELLTWLLHQRRTRHPRHVRIAALELGAASAYWVRVENREDPLRFIRVDAEVVAPNVIRINTDNVLAITLSPPAELVDPGRPVQVDWNGRALPPTVLTLGKATFAAPDYHPTRITKRPELAGPLRAVMTTPFAIVVGTQSRDERTRAFCQRRADRMADSWQEQQHYPPRTFRDVDLSENELRRYSLVLIGGPDENAVTRRLIADLPLRLHGARVTIAGHTFAAPDSLVELVCPHPLNPNRYVRLEVATSPAAYYYRALNRDPLGFRVLEGVDWYILDSRIADPAAGRPDDKVCLASGFFDREWRYAGDYTEEGDDALRSRCARQKAPRYLSTAVATDTLYLGDVLETTTSGGFTDVARDQSATHQALTVGGRTAEHGLGLSVWRPWEKHSAIEWDLSGDWAHLRARVGLQLSSNPAHLTGKCKSDTKVRFFVKTDGKERFKSRRLTWNSAPVDLDVPLTGVRRLRLETLNEGGNHAAAVSMNWADLRLER